MCCVYPNVFKGAPLSIRRTWLALPCVLNDAVLSVDFVSICRVICMIKIVCKIQQRMQGHLKSCRIATGSLCSFFDHRQLLSLQSYKGCNPMCSKREEAKEMVGNQLSCLHFLVILLDDQHECWWPVISGVMSVRMKNRFSIIKEQEKWGIRKRAYVQNVRFMGHQ
jgi:hypothetical protein